MLGNQTKFVKIHPFKCSYWWTSRWQTSMFLDITNKSKANKPQNKIKENRNTYLGKKYSIYIFASFECLQNFCPLNMTVHKAYKKRRFKNSRALITASNKKVNIWPQHLVTPYIIGLRSFIAYSVRANRLSANTIILSHVLSWKFMRNSHALNLLGFIT